MSTPPLQLFYYPGHASLAPHILLQELDLDYELVLIDIKNGAQFEKYFMKINPQCKIPVLSNGGEIITESAAICTWIALNNNYISAKDTQQLPWMFFLSNTLQPALMEFHYPELKVGDNQQVIANARNTIEKHLQFINSQLSQADTLSGEFSIADIYLFMLCYWCRTLLNEINEIEQLKAAFKTHRYRPSVDTVFKKEGIEMYKP